MANITSTTIQFVTQTVGAGASISVELDDDRNNNRSQFASGDTVYLKVYTSPVNMTVSGESSSGSVTKGSRSTGTVTEQVTFANEKEANLRYIADSISSFRWFGNNCGQPSVNGNRISIPAAAVGVLEVTYNATYTQWSLGGVTIPAGLSEFPVLVVLTETT